MHSLIVLAEVACVLAVPGIAASLAAFRPGEVAIVTRLAAAFGLGYAAAGSCAFLLAAVHAFRLSFFIPLWLVVSAVLWVVALRRASIHDQLTALIDDVNNNLFPLLLGAAVVGAVLIAHVRYLYLLGAPRYVYYLNGLEIANSHGVPSATLEYGQSWAPATDKIFLDAFTGVVGLISNNVAVGPGVLLWVSTFGAAIGLWATAWELGIRRVGGLLPLLLLGNSLILNIAVVTGDFTDYRSEDFGRAVAFCALALGIFAIRERRTLPAIIAGLVLGAASGTHLVPVVVVAIGLLSAGVAEFLRGHGTRNRLAPFQYGIILAAVGGVAGIIIRIFAGGSFGLGGASSPSTYNSIHTSFDPTAYLYYGGFIPRAKPGSGPWYLPPSQTLYGMMTGSHFHWPSWALWVIFAAAVAATVLLFLLARDELRDAGVVGLGIFLGVMVIALAFDFHYHVYIEATFGVRRLREATSFGLIIIALGVIEALIGLLARHRARLAVAVSAVVVIALAAWLLPNNSLRLDTRLSRQRTTLINWMRTQTPCDARFLVNQRTEGPVTSLTGRYALLEGMGPFLRVDKLPYVVSLLLGSRQFFQDPQANEAYLRQHGISYVVVSRVPFLLGYPGPTGVTNVAQMNSAPFLQRVLVTPAVIVYRVVGAHPAPVSPLLKGPVLHCIRTPVRY
ncbi:MAG TPA: hypothetical protein VEC76_02545 [Streptosporangiaceae bacterium]|nr:hypothetical protein [Streptosporangiaceae bacterium]